MKAINIAFEHKLKFC